MGRLPGMQDGTRRPLLCGPRRFAETWIPSFRKRDASKDISAPLLDTHRSASTRDTSKIEAFSTLDAFNFFKWNTPILDGKHIG